MLLFRGRQPLAVKRDSFQQIHRSIELHIVRVANPFLIFRIKRFNAAHRALQENIALLFVAHRHDNIRRDAMFMNNLVARRIIFGRGQPQR